MRPEHWIDYNAPAVSAQARLLNSMIDRFVPAFSCPGIDGGNSSFEPNPVADDSTDMPQGLIPLTMNTLLFQSSDHTLSHPVLLSTLGRDDLLLQTVAYDHCCEAPADED